MDSTRVAACQTSVAELDVQSNLETVIDRVVALPSDVELAVFPEYALTGFVGDDRLFDAALSADGPELDRLAAAAARNECALLVGFLERASESATGESSQVPASAADVTLYNAAAYVSPDGERSVYRKRHRWGGEDDWIERGDERVTVETPAGTAGVLTCYDLNFVEESAAMAREGVDLLLVPGAWPGEYSENWRLLCRARALDGVRWVVAAGRTGARDCSGVRRVEYAGRSMVVRPDGSIMAATNRMETDVVATLDHDELHTTRAFIPVLDGDDSGESA